MRPFLGRLRARFAAWLATKPAGFGLQLSFVVMALALHVGHYLVYCLPQPWWIEDAAISFAYARNWVDGYGLVPYVGGEHVEGYSNPLWTFLLGFFYLIGVTPWTSAKIMGAVFGCVAQLFAWGIARRALPERQKWAAVLVPFLLGASVQFTLWNASGLENSLFCMLLGAGLYRVIVEVEEDDPRPYSAIAFMLLTITRPDGLAYAGIGLLARTIGAVWHGQWKAWVWWVLAFAVPYSGYFAWRWDTFAWEWPNTWYAKKKNFDPTNWNQLGWKQMREYTWNYGILWVTPLIAVAVTGVSRWRKWAVLTVLVLMTAAAGWDGKLVLGSYQIAFLATLPLLIAALFVPSRHVPLLVGAALLVGLLCIVPGLTNNEYESFTLSRLKGKATGWIGSHWSAIRVGVLAAGAAIIGALAFGQPGWLTRGVLWCCYSFGLFYTILATGDWMKAYRWYSLTSIPQFVLLAVGAVTLGELLPGALDRLTRRVRLGPIYVLVPVVAIMVANIGWASTFVLRPETAPRDVHRRVEYMRWVQNRLDLDRPTLLDVDMGAHLWWSDWFIADIAGLVDVPMAQHDYEKAFVREYLFEEVRPSFAHAHGSWAGTLKVASHPEWKEQYLEIPGYPTGKRSLHVGNHVRKDLIATDLLTTDATRQVRFASGVRMEHWALPAPVVAKNGELFVETSWRSAKREGAIRVVLFLAREGKVAWSGEVAPGYGWYEADRWQAWEEVKGNWSVELPRSLGEGEYQVGLVVLDSKTGAVLPVEGAGPGGAPLWGEDDLVPEAAPVVPVMESAAVAPAAGPAVYMQGEVLLTETVRIVGSKEALAEADRVLVSAVTAASAGDCESGQRQWRNAKRHAVHTAEWRKENETAGLGAVVACLVARATAMTDQVAAAAVLADARFLSPKHAGIAVVGVPLGLALDVTGVAAAAEHDWEAAYVAFRAALQADPKRALSRRRAEDMRDRRLKIGDYDAKKGSKDIDTQPLPGVIPFRG